MDCSEVSEYDNITNVDVSASESVLYQAVNNVLSATTTNGNKMFCPLCVETFQFKFALLEHLRESHSNFLRRAPDANCTLEQCPFCYANFFGRQTVIKHALRTHSRLIAQLYLNVRDGPEVAKCFFCTNMYDKRRASKFTLHIEREHLLQFADVFDEQFMRFNDSLLSQESPPSKPHDKNCFDFTRLKEELCYMDDTQSGLKSIMKGRKSACRMAGPVEAEKTKVCRVLQFDIPSENKENSVLAQNMNAPKQITLAEHSLLCNNNGKEKVQLFTVNMNASANGDIMPLHSSTPKCLMYKSKTHMGRKRSKCDVKLTLETKEKMKKRGGKVKVKSKPTFKSYCLTKGADYQCSKCSSTFEDGLELHCHIKKNHKSFIFTMHPLYQCAICKAKFFNNHYLKKHVKHHSGTKHSGIRF